MAAKSKQQSDQIGKGEGVTFTERYPHIAGWVLDGWVEIGRVDYSESIVRALDEGGLVWEGAAEYATLEDALQALDAGIATWLEEN